MKKIIGIWAQTENGIIGKDQVMPWHLPAELQHFKEPWDKQFSWEE